MKAILEIKTAHPEDAQIIASLLAESFAEYEPLYTAAAFSATTPNEAVIKNRFGEGEMWIDVLGKKIVGTVSVVPKNKSLYIRSMAILPEARGHRIGERLLTEIENYAVADGFGRLILSTTPFLYRAIRLYKKFGFERFGSSDLCGTPLIEMEKLCSPFGGDCVLVQSDA